MKGVIDLVLRLISVVALVLGLVGENTNSPKATGALRADSHTTQVRAGSTVAVTALPRTALHTTTIDSPTVRVDRLTIGVSHTQYTADPWENPLAVHSAMEVLDSISLQDQAMMGWGTLNPEPAPGVWNWASMDERMNLIRSSGGTPVITLAGAPDWMKGGAVGQTDWSQLNVAPEPQFDQAFAQLAVAAASRYPYVKRFLVWNEFKGMWNSHANTWDYVRYTNLYNAVYDALKAYDPAIEVGGPYIVFDSYVGVQPHPSKVSGAWGVLDQRPLDAMLYWLQHKHGADFVAVDASAEPVDSTRLQSIAVSTAKFAAISTWVRSVTSLPVWWAEIYPTSASASPSEQAAAVVSSIIQSAWGGDSAMMLWQPQASGSECDGCLWTDTAQSGGGRPTPLGLDLEKIEHVLTSGVSMSLMTTPAGVIGVESGTHTILVNETSRPIRVAMLSGVSGALGPYQVVVADP